ncbi:hypothetical protein SRHO_G00097060 [Serrasalmus rhombeus]
MSVANVSKIALDTPTDAQEAENTPTNSDILREIRSLKDSMNKQSTDMLKAINDIKGEIQSHSQRIGETEERISQTEDDRRPRKLQRNFDDVKARFRALGVRYGMLYPAHLIITHNDKRRIFKSVTEAEKFIQEISSHAGGHTGN